MLKLKWYETRIKLLKNKVEFLEREMQIFEINGFERFANELKKEIAFIREDINDLSNEMALKRIDEPIGLKGGENEIRNYYRL
jgi:hypothetical protein